VALDSFISLAWRWRGKLENWVIMVNTEHNRNTRNNKQVGLFIIACLHNLSSRSCPNLPYQ
jgi:hypothetical protein